MKRFVSLVCLCLVFSTVAFGATEFVCTIKQNAGAGVDYTSLTSWNSAVKCDIGNVQRQKRYFHGGITGTLSLRDVVWGSVSGSTGSVVTATASYIIIQNSTGTFVSGEQVYRAAGNLVTLSDNGNSLTTMVFSHSGITGAIADGSTVWGSVSGSTGTAVHVSDTQILIKWISGTFQNGENAYKDGTNRVTLTNAGDTAIATAKIDGAWSAADTGSIYTYKQDWGTSAGNYLRIYTTPAARHNGIWDNTKYRHIYSGSGSSIYFTNYERFDGMQFARNENTVATGVGIFANNEDNTKPGEVQVSNCLFNYAGAGVDISTEANHAAAMGTVNSRGGVLKLWNNIFTNWGMGIYTNHDHNGAPVPVVYYIYNNTFINCDRGTIPGLMGAIRLGDNNDTVSVYMRNNLIQGSTLCYSLSPFDVYVHNNNISSDASSPDGLTNRSATYLNASAGNYLLARLDAVAQDAGAGLSADAGLAFTTDIQGETRPYNSGVWDVGADEMSIAPDSIPPAPVTDLTIALGPSGGQAVLTWTAPGNDGTSSTITSGTDKIQYSTNAGVTWSTASAQVTISTGNVNPGDQQQATVGSLVGGSTYYFRLWTGDEQPNYSTISNGATIYMPDTVAPAATGNLAATLVPGSGTVVLTWPSAGNDGVLGNLLAGSSYYIQRSTFPQVVWAQASAQIKLSTSGVAPGDVQLVIDPSLTAQVTYYYRLWTADSVPNNSVISNGATVYIVDFTNPGTINSLSATQGGSNEIVLSWNTPGDDGGSNVLDVGSKYRIQGATYTTVSWGTSSVEGTVVQVSTNGVAIGANVATKIGSLLGRATYYFRIWTQDEAGLWSGISNGATNFTYGDLTAPSTPYLVRDGSTFGSDAAFTYSTTTLSANWDPAVDPESGIGSYQYAIGSTAGAVDISGWATNGTATTVTKTGLSTLSVNATYYFTVRAINGDAITGAAANSNGQYIRGDDTPPVWNNGAAVRDGTGVDISSTSSFTQLSANWDIATDSQSSLTAYWYAIGSTVGGTQAADWTSVGTSTSVTRGSLTLLVGTSYFFSVKAENGAGAMSSVLNSNGVIVSTYTPPLGGLQVVSACYISTDTFRVYFSSAVGASGDVAGNFTLTPVIAVNSATRRDSNVCVEIKLAAAVENKKQYIVTANNIVSVSGDGQDTALNSARFYGLNPTPLFSDDFNRPAGSLLTSNNPAGLWTTKTFDAGCSLSIVSSASICGTGLFMSDESDIGDTAELSKSFTAQTSCYVRVYYYLPTGMTALGYTNSPNWRFLLMYTTTGRRFYTMFNCGAGSNNSFKGQGDGGAGWSQTSPFGALLENQWTCFEMYLPPASATMVCKYWVDGKLQTMTDTLDYSGALKWNQIVFGLDYGPTDSMPNYFFDELVVAQGYVGTVSTHTITPTWSNGAVVRDGTGATDASVGWSTTTLSANWDVATDSTGVMMTYYYTIGTTVGGTEILDWTDVGGLITNVTKTALTLTKGTTYYVSVKALSDGGYSTVLNSNGQYIDIDVSAPVGPTAVLDGTGATETSTTYSTMTLSANWDAASDPETGIAKYWYAIGTTAGGVDVVGWTDNGTLRTVTKAGLALTVGTKYYFTAKAQNGAGVEGIAANSSGITVTADPTAPTAPAAVRDGTGATDDATTTSLTQLSANWDASSDTETGVNKYWYAIGTTAGGTDVVNWTDNGNTTSVTKTGLTLTLQSIYYFSVKAENSQAMQGTATNSDGIEAIETVPPVVTKLPETNLKRTQMTINWTTDEPATTQVEYGASTAYGTLTTIDNTLTTEHTVTLTGLSAGVAYHYRIRSKDVFGNEAISSDYAPVRPLGEPTVKVFPNPCDFANGSQMKFWVAGNAGGTVKIYTADSRLVRTLTAPAGTNEVSWDGKNDSGQDTKTGTYIYVSAGSSKLKGKLLIVR